MVGPEGASDCLRENFLEVVAQPGLEDEKVAARSKRRLRGVFQVGPPRTQQPALTSSRPAEVGRTLR